MKTKHSLFSISAISAFFLGIFMMSTQSVADEVYDPLESVNRKTFAFNQQVDRFVYKPAAKLYVKIFPDPINKGISNFFGNLGEVKTVANDLLQLKFKRAMSDTGRFLVNTTIGFGGLIDAATSIGLEKNQEDFGQTLGYWGVGPGPFIEIPFLGPANLRDGLSRIPDSYTSPIHYVDDDGVRYGLTGLEVVDLRAQLLSAEKLLSGDKYLAIRDGYSQYREFLVQDGVVEDDFVDDDF